MVDNQTVIHLLSQQPKSQQLTWARLSPAMLWKASSALILTMLRTVTTMRFPSSVSVKKSPLLHPK